jgi:predicted flap endonuclease-1-like 5' DNA nuclease
MKGIIVWLLAFLSFLAGLNVFNSMMLMTLHGGDFLAEFSISGLALGNVTVMAYLLISIIATFVLLGSTVYFVFKGLPADPDLLQRLAELESFVAANSNLLENTQMGFFRRLEDNEKVTDEAFRKIHMGLEEARKETNDALEKQKKILQDVQKESNDNAAIIKKQAKDMTTVRKRVGKIEKVLSPALKAAKLKSNSKLDAVGGVKPSLAQGLKTMGIKTVGQFLTIDPVAIAEKTMESPDTVTSLQAKTQLLMVPGLDPNDAELLVKVGITSRKELANQDPVQLCRTLVGIANVYVEQGKMTIRQVPTIDDVWSWIKLAQP